MENATVPADHRSIERSTDHEDSFESTIVKLEIIGKLKVGDKLHIDNQTNYSIDHPSWYNSISRWYLGNDRTFTTKELDELLKKVGTYIKTSNDKDQQKTRLIRSIRNCISGLRSLICTYQSDLQIVSSLENIIERYQLLLS